MENNLTKKYGLPTAITMVIGIVIGSGVFFKAEVILNATGGNLPVGILAWLIGGLVMVSCAYVFSIMATKYEYVNGLVDYTEELMGRTAAYYVGWYSTTVYYPAMTSVLAWVSARYTCVLIGLDITGGECITLACFYLIAIFAINVIAPKAAGALQISTTIIKLVPLILMAIVGTIIGLINGTTVENFTTVVTQDISGNPLFTAVVATVFAYEGWIIALSINAELRDAKKNLPRALTIGTLVIVVVYIAYYVGLAGAVSNSVLMENGEQGALIAFGNIFGRLGGVLFIFVIISCLGTLNGLMMGCTRGLYSIAARNEGLRPDIFSKVDSTTSMPTNSGVFGLAMCGFWLLFFYWANLSPVSLGGFGFDSSELPIVALYVFYIPLFIKFIIGQESGSVFRKYIMPIIAICGCIFMTIATYFAHGSDILSFLAVLVVCLAIGAFFKRKHSS